MTAQKMRRSSIELEYHGIGDQELDFDNSGDGPLRVPGFGYEIAAEHPPDARFAHGFLDWAQNRLTAREISMLDVMNRITDKPGWQNMLDDADVVDRWASEAMALPLISPQAWDWCLAELRDKADLYAATGLVYVLNSASRVCKSDTLISAQLLHSLEAAVESLRQDTEDGDVSVNPDLYPLVYGTTRVLSQGGSLGSRTDAILASGEGIVASKPFWRIYEDADHLELRRIPYDRTRGWEHSAFRFSPTFQWLPCEVAFLPGDGPSPAVEVSSYVNSLHPVRHGPLYSIIEHFISASIAPWNEVLVYRDRGRDPQRIITYGVRWEPDFPAWAASLATIQDKASEAYQDVCQRAEAFMALPENPRLPRPNRHDPVHKINAGDWEDKLGLSRAVCIKYERVRRWLHPEPGESFSYVDWKAGKNNLPVVNGHMLGGKRPLPPKKDHQYYSVSLQDTFGTQGLQVVVEMGSIELKPEEPSCGATDWRLCGLLNEHIVATTMVYFSSSNVTPESGALSFRVEADLDASECIFGRNLSKPFHEYEPLADVYGVIPSIDLGESRESGAGCAAVQELGTVLAPDGRSVTFSNVMQHRLQACALLDPTRPGRRRFLRLHLVDPHYRICSTRHVPPQQNDWWAEAGWRQIDWAARGMPPELVDMVAKEVGEWPMGQAEAERLRLELCRERGLRQERTMDGILPYKFGEWAAMD